MKGLAARSGPCVQLDHRSGREFSIVAKQVLNATGPWSDTVRRLAGDDSGPLLQPTKGVHLVAADRGLSAAFLLLHPADGRVFFVIPWMHKTLLGTTDTVCDESPDGLGVTPEDVEYLLAGFNHYFTPPLSAAEVLGRFAGLRPLIGTRPGEPSDLSREFQLTTSSSGLLTVAGGKYTTYRQMAEVITDTVVRRLGLFGRCRTRSFRLDGAPEEAWHRFAPSAISQLTTRCHFEAETSRHLIERYGRRAVEVADYLERDPRLAGVWCPANRTCSPNSPISATTRWRRRPPISCCGARARPVPSRVAPDSACPDPFQLSPEDGGGIE